MLKKLAAGFLVLLFFVTGKNVSAEEYDWEKVYDFACKRLVNCVATNGEWDHSIYYFAEGDNRCLVVICHGFYNNEGYGIQMHKKFRHDYAQAVAESLAYWSKQGKLQCGPYDYVFMNTCYSGYAPQNTNLPMFNVNLHMAINFRGITGYIEHFDENGNVDRVSLWKSKLVHTAVAGGTKSIGGMRTPPGLKIL